VWVITVARIAIITGENTTEIYAGGGTEVSSGEGTSATEAVRQLQANGQNGTYRVVFTIEKEDGSTITADRAFYIDS
jgi:hypothetical protein